MTKQTEEASLDLAVYDDLQRRQEEGVDVPIKDPAGKDLGFSIRVAGPDSKMQRAALRTLTSERLAQESTEEPTDEENRRREARGVALCTIGWSPFKLDGGEYKFSVENATALYLRFPFIRSQVEFRAERRAAFLLG